MSPVTRLSITITLLTVSIASAWALNKSAIVNVSVTIFASPPCVINSNNIINVNFGDGILTSQIDGTKYMQPVDYTLDCIAAAHNNLKMSIRGNAASFGNGILSTGITGLGIQLMQGGQPLALNTAFNFTHPTKPVLQAVPVKQANATLTTGNFTASATLVVEYQ